MGSMNCHLMMLIKMSVVVVWRLSINTLSKKSENQIISPFFFFYDITKSFALAVAESEKTLTAHLGACFFSPSTLNTFNLSNPLQFLKTIILILGQCNPI